MFICVCVFWKISAIQSPDHTVNVQRRIVSSLPLRKTRSSIRVDRGSGLTRPLLSLAPLPMVVTPHHQSKCYPTLSPWWIVTVAAKYLDLFEPNLQFGVSDHELFLAKSFFILIAARSELGFTPAKNKYIVTGKKTTTQLPSALYLHSKLMVQGP